MSRIAAARRSADRVVIIALAMLLGRCALLWIPQLQPYPWQALTAASLVVAVATLLWARSRWRRFLLAAAVTLSAFSHAGMQARQELDCRLSEDLAGRDLDITGHIDSLPGADAIAVRFEFSVERMLMQQPGSAACTPRRLRLAWYRGQGELPVVEPGQRWRFTVRLKPPHGFANPGGFDYERWLFQRGVHATGYVRSAEALPVSASPTVDTARLRINGFIHQAAGDGRAGVLQALATGTRQSIAERDWQVLIATGTNHLVAISGLHIGLAATFGWWLVTILGRRRAPAAWLQRVALQDVAVVTGLVVACLYAALSGMAVPAQRALIMLFCFGLARLWRRHVSAVAVLSLALILILLLQPAAVHSAGFWFSFFAVAIIVALYRQGLGQRAGWLQFLVIQVCLSLGMMPVSLFLFQQAPLVSIPANLVMVPLVSLLVVPLVLLALLSMPLSALLAQGLLMLADALLSLAWPWLVWLAELEHGGVAASLSLAQLALLMAGPLLLLAGRRRQAVVAAPLLLLLGWSMQHDDRPGAGEFSVHVLDVGQGSAVLLRTRQHAVLYDTGADYGRLDAGSSVILPVLRSMGLATLDLVMISHGDNDHAGGLRSLRESLRIDRIVGQLDAGQHAGASSCHAGQRWQFDRVVFEVLHPAAEHAYAANDSSCVLRVSGRGGSLLLAGDIERRAERALLAAGRDSLRADLLLVPHHGSKTSSSRGFVAAVAADLAVITAGYRNRYRLPAAEVVARYRNSGSRVLVSGHTGMISVPVSERGVGEALRYRESHPAFWRHRRPRRGGSER